MTCRLILHIQPGLGECADQVRSFIDHILRRQTLVEMGDYASDCTCNGAGLHRRKLISVGLRNLVGTTASPYLRFRQHLQV